jgi:hypothetical protein
MKLPMRDYAVNVDVYLGDIKYSVLLVHHRSAVFR